jgi:hypothetical protein
MLSDPTVFLSMLFLGLLVLVGLAVAFKSVSDHKWVAAFFRFGFLSGIIGVTSALVYVGDHAYSEQRTFGGGFGTDVESTIRLTDSTTWGTLPTWFLVLPFVIAAILFAVAAIVLVIQNTASIKTMFAFGKTRRQLDHLSEVPVGVRQPVRSGSELHD